MYFRSILRGVRPHLILRSTPGRIRPIFFHIFRMASSLPRLPIFEAIAGHDPSSTAVIHSRSGRSFSYGELLNDVVEARDKLLSSAVGGNLDDQRVAFLVENGYDYVGTNTTKMDLV